jgi:hypothetical protein
MQPDFCRSGFGRDVASRKDEGKASLLKPLARKAEQIVTSSKSSERQGKKMLKRMLLLCTLALSGAAFAVDPGTLTKAETLRAKPFMDAAAVSNLATGAKVDIITRNGAWYQVKSGTKTGWVRMLSVRRGAATPSSNIAGLANVASGRTGTGKVTTTTGVRGLDAQDLDTAKFDEAQIKSSEGWRINAKDANAFARAGKLTLRDVKPLPSPAKK